MLQSFVVEGGAAESGWTSYPALALFRWAAPGSLNGQTLWIMALLFAGVSSVMGSINYITTILMLRAPGMKLFRMPMTVWAMFVTAILQAVALPVLTSGMIMLLLDRTLGTNFFTPVGWSVGNQPGPVGGGQPLLWQHLFWFYSHPAVYVMILPAMGMVSDILTTFARKPLFGYRPMVYSIAGIAGLPVHVKNVATAAWMSRKSVAPPLAILIASMTRYVRSATLSSSNAVQTNASPRRCACAMRPG
jgi:cytochrome c oxidase subunit 1